MREVSLRYRSQAWMIQTLWHQPHRSTVLLGVGTKPQYQGAARCEVTTDKSSHLMALRSFSTWQKMINKTLGPLVFTAVRCVLDEIHSRDSSIALRFLHTWVWLSHIALEQVQRNVRRPPPARTAKASAESALTNDDGEKLRCDPAVFKPEQSWRRGMAASRRILV